MFTVTFSTSLKGGWGNTVPGSLTCQLTHPRVIWEGSLTWGTSQSRLACGHVYGGRASLVIYGGGSSPSWVAPFPSRWCMQGRGKASKAGPLRRPPRCVPPWVLFRVPLSSCPAIPPWGTVTWKWKMKQIHSSPVLLLTRVVSRSNSRGRHENTHSGLQKTPLQCQDLMTKTKTRQVFKESVS